MDVSIPWVTNAINMIMRIKRCNAKRREDGGDVYESKDSKQTENTMESENTKGNAARRSIPEKGIPIDAGLWCFARAAKEALEALFPGVFWAARLHVPHAECDVTLRDYDYKIFVDIVVLVGLVEARISEYAVDEAC